MSSFFSAAFRSLGERTGASPAMVVLSVQQLLTYLRELFETNATLGDLWVAGEVSNLTRSSAGHMYFTLKDAAGQIRCVFFRRQNAGMTLEHRWAWWDRSPMMMKSPSRR